MKITLIISVILAVFSVLLPLAVLAGAPLPDVRITDTEAAEPAPDEAESRRKDTGTDTDTDTADADDADAPDIDVDVLIEGGVVTLPLEEYLTGVVAAEMPVSFEPEALKAQAVAARTYTLYKIQAGPSADHPDAAVCDDPTCCKAYSSDEKLREKWGTGYEENLAKMALAVQETRGEYMTYENEPILAVFHASSAGMTETSGVVWGRNMPYLLSVESPETEEEVVNYVTEVRVSAGEFRETLLREYPDADLSGGASSWITGMTHTTSDRISSVIIGGVSVKGTRLRSMFGLRSTHMTIDAGDEEIVFIITGSGHGVGMSQYGANSLAKKGYGYRDILLWYYTGVDFAKLFDS